MANVEEVVQPLATLMNHETDHKSDWISSELSNDTSHLRYGEIALSKLSQQVQIVESRLAAFLIGSFQ
jgi:hypothetical protein